MNKEVRISVVIPLYNKADTIERAVRSVRAQTYPCLEIIIVNDGSTDNVDAVLRHICEQGDVKVVTQANAGVSAARNAGAGVARGEYVALLDADDYWYPNHLERMAAAIRKYGDVELFGGGYELQKFKHLYFTIQWPWTSIKDVYKAFSYAQPIHTSSLVVKREAWNRIGGFDRRFSFFEDYHFLFRLGEITKCCIVHRISERYCDDASERLTQVDRPINETNYPHWAWLEEKIQAGVATREMLGYARIITLLRMCFPEGNYEEFFPGMSRTVPKSMQRVFRSRFIYPIFRQVFLAWYRIHNHLIVWRR